MFVKNTCLTVRKRIYSTYMYMNSITHLQCVSFSFRFSVANGCPDVIWSGGRDDIDSDDGDGRRVHRLS